MDSDSKYQLSILGMILSFLLGMAFCFTFHAYATLDKWDKAVSNGADPMVTTCALYSNASPAICTILAQNRK